MGAWWCDQFLPFGCRTSPVIFDLFASILEYNFQAQRGWKHLLHYLDGFLAIFPKEHFKAVQMYKADFSQIYSDLGFRIKEEKNEEGLRIKFFGIEIDTEKMAARLPQDKHEKAVALVDCNRENRIHKLNLICTSIRLLA
jgi:hypothetical protein